MFEISIISRTLLNAIMITNLFVFKPLWISGNLKIASLFDCNKNQIYGSSGDKIQITYVDLTCWATYAVLQCTNKNCFTRFLEEWRTFGSENLNKANNKGIRFNDHHYSEFIFVWFFLFIHFFKLNSI